MHRVQFGRPSPAMVVASIALFVALGGTGYAASQLGHPAGHAAKKKRKASKHTDSAQDIKLIHKEASKLKGPKGDVGAQGAAGAPGSPGAAGAAGTARAYGLVSQTGALNATVRKNVVAVSNPSAGTFCITLAAGIDTSTTRANATLSDESDI